MEDVNQEIGKEFSKEATIKETMELLKGQVVDDAIVNQLIGYYKGVIM